MELKELLDILNKHRLFLLLTAIVCAVVALVGSLQIPPVQSAQITLYVKRTAQPASEEFYNYDGYYAQQAAERYADTVVGLLQSRSLLKDSLLDLGLPTDQKFLRSVGKKINVRKTAPQLVKVEVHKRWKGGVSWIPKDLANVLSSRVVEKVDKLNTRGGDDGLSVDVLSQDLLVEVRNPNIVLNTMVAALFGFLVAFFVVTFRRYLEN
ncbi:MAG: Wzz/FepE/Etk N-terminal domain-containing protein [Patescibacteria group bacterium]|nr:Wzz/FepE/Etk N-terminal domain-containing protein [Patescibacteria group bacterium]